MKNGVVFTSGRAVHADRLLPDEAAWLQKFRICAPKQPSVILTGVGRRHQAMRDAIGLPFSELKLACLGRSEFQPQVHDPGQIRGIQEAFRSAPDNFVALVDSPVLSALGKLFRVKPIGAYLLRLSESNLEEIHFSALGEDGVVITPYPTS